MENETEIDQNQMMINELQRLSQHNTFLVNSMTELYSMQMKQTQEMWTLINKLYDRSDMANPVPRDE